MKVKEMEERRVVDSFPIRLTPREVYRSECSHKNAIFTGRLLLSNSKLRWGKSGNSKKFSLIESILKDFQ
tara:strand:- start:609 stop:818 length:210 start_codon:yes stop_codon:yes gene_type:complete